MHGAEVSLEEAHALLVFERLSRPSQSRAAAGSISCDGSDGLKCARPLVQACGEERLQGAAVFRDRNASLRPVAPLHIGQELPEAPRHDGPAHVGLLPGRIGRLRDAQVLEVAASAATPKGRPASTLHALSNVGPVANEGVAAAKGASWPIPSRTPSICLPASCLRPRRRAPNVAGAVRVEAEEVAGALEDLALLLREGGEPCAQGLAHALRVFTEVDRVCKPTELKVHGSLRGLDVLSPVAPQGLLPLCVEHDPDLAALEASKLLLVDVGDHPVNQDHVVSNPVHVRGL
mmetsp:Transcript_47924/g.115218  ORF Transcript_47924/g.115218 Transcript_47924/m.115218 type:complete len:290 (-) Transcript_47924:84-953(-)